MATYPLPNPNEAVLEASTRPASGISKVEGGGVGVVMQRGEVMVYREGRPLAMPEEILWTKGAPQESSGT